MMILKGKRPKGFETPGRLNWLNCASDEALFNSHRIAIVVRKPFDDKGIVNCASSLVDMLTITMAFANVAVWLLY